MIQLKNILSLSIFITLFLAAGCATSQYGFDDWDGNDDDLIESWEFNQAISDTDYFSNWDTDNDGILTEEEWGIGTAAWRDNGIDIEYSDWDLNNDNEVTEYEFGRGFFDTLDDDDSDTIDQDEWDLFDLDDDGDLF